MTPIDQHLLPEGRGQSHSPATVEYLMCVKRFALQRSDGRGAEEAVIADDDGSVHKLAKQPRRDTSGSGHHWIDLAGFS